MKRIFWCVFIVTIMSPINNYAQLQPPNSDFEEWVTLTNGAENPMGWGSSNFAVSFGVPQTVFKTTDSKSGDFALMVVTPSNGETIYPGQVELNEAAFDDGGLPYTDRPLSMEAWIKGSIQVGDTAFVRARLTRWIEPTQTTELIAVAYIEQTITDTTYSLQIDSFEYFTSGIPDTLFLVAGFGEHDQVIDNADNQLFVDNIVFKGLSTKVSEAIRFKGVQVFPNPSNGVVQLNINLSKPSDLMVTLYDDLGHAVLSFEEKQALNLKKSIDMRSFRDGLYYMRLNAEGTHIVRKIMLMNTE